MTTSLPSAGNDKLFLRVLNGEAARRPPVWLMRQAGRYLPEYRKVRAGARDFLDLCYRPDLAAEVTLQPLRRYRLDASIVFADILLIPHALGQHLEFVEGEGPRLEPLAEAGGIASLRGEGALAHLAPVMETLRRVRRELPDDVALIGFAGAPWTVATYMIEGRGSPDQKAARQWALRDPEGFDALLGILSEATIAYLDAQIEAGAEAVQLFDSWAVNLPEDLFERVVIAPTAHIVHALRSKHPHVPVIGFPRLCGGHLGAYALATGVNAVGLDTGVPLGWARTVLPGHVASQGNLDPLALIEGGAALEEAAARILRLTRGRPHVFNLGHGILPETPPEHVAALIDFIHQSAGGE